MAHIFLKKTSFVKYWQKGICCINSQHWEEGSMNIGEPRNRHQGVSANLLSEKDSVVVAQLVERSLPTPEVRSSNPVIGKIY